MINFKFKDVGQGDSILIEWTKDNINHYGIIDCNLYNNKNPILNEVIDKKIKYLDFVVISHLHYDHYSGFADLFEHFINENIKIGIFFHTFNTEYFRIFSSILVTQKQWGVTNRFLNAFDKAEKKGLIKTIEVISPGLYPVNLTGSINLSFLSPNGKDYKDFAFQQARYLAKQTNTPPDFNNLSSIIQISDSIKTVLLTSDAPQKSFKRIISVIQKKVQLVQVPHHGSLKNLLPSFWQPLKIKSNCPAIFSVGDVKKDKLPNRSVVEFFDNRGFYNESTNYVYGIAEYYAPSSMIPPKALSLSLSLSALSLKKSTTLKTIVPPTRFLGDRSHNLL